MAESSQALSIKPPAPPPPTPGVVGASSIRTSRAFRFASSAWRWKGLIAGGVAVTYGVVLWESEKRKAQIRDTIHDNTYLYWKIYDGGIVEAKSAGSNLNYLLSSSQGGSPEEPPRVMELFDVVRAIKFIESDDRIRGIIADFSSTSVPSVPSYNLGLAQLEEIQDALLELRRVKQDKFGKGPEGWRTIAWTDTFYGQGQYLLASAFDEVYLQPSGEVPLVGMGSTTPFYGRLAKWLGIEVHAEARTEYKSFVQPYIDEKFTDAQRANHLSLLSDLNDNLLTYLGRNRFPSLSGRASLDRLKSLSQVGPFSAARAAEAGLVDGVCYRQDVLDAVQLDGEDKETGVKMMGFFHYAKILERVVEKYMKDTIDVGVVYLLGGIGDPGEFGTASVCRGLKEAGDDPEIGAVVLRVDSGGGSVVDSDTIGAAVRDLRNKGKTVVASFGNSAASGGYWVSTHADAILAAPSTVTGSIGVAALRPTFLQRFFDRFHLTLESLYLGSRASDVTHQLTPEEVERYKKGVDAMYQDFKDRVCDGRGISKEVIDEIAGGRVMTGLRAFEIVAPRELVEQIKGWGGEGEEGKKVKEVKEGVVPKEDKAVALLPEGEEMSAFAVPQVVEACAPHSSSSSSSSQPSTSDSSAPSAVVDNPAVLNALAAALTAPALSSSSPSSSSLSRSPPSRTSPSHSSSSSPPPEHPSGAVNGAAGLYEYDATGPHGRGLVDGLGGLRDAAIYATQMFIANGVSGYKLEHPDVTDEEAIKVLLPDANSLCILIVQCFYIWRLHHVSMGHAWPLVLFLSLAALATVACAIRMFAFCATTQLLALYSDSSLQAWLWAWYSLAIVNDFVITASLWYYVVHKPQKNHTGKTTITRSPLMRIIHRSYQTNAISLALQVLILILLGSARDAFRYGIAAFSVGKCYAGCLIACLNSRRSSGRFDELDSPISPSPVAIVPSLARKFTSNRRTSRSRNGNVGDRPNTSTQSVQVTVDHSIAVEVDPNPVWAPSDEGVNERYAVMFDGRERKDVEKGMSSTGDGTEVEEVELDRYA
ncbi:hypothetical protein JCM8547_006672 [Rhodosporidiobolus lusitaniae]